MPVMPNLIERLVLLTLNLAPAIMLDFLGAQAFRIFAAAHRLGVIEALVHGPLTAVQVAREIEADERGTTLLLEALEALGYVRKKAGRYVATSMTAKWLPILSPGINWFEIMIERCKDLEKSVRQGGPVIDPREWLDQRPGGWRDFQGGMITLARMGADEIAAKVRLPRTARRLLDVGGGHGLYSVALCRRYPQLSATVFDLPEALKAARTTIAAGEMSDRVELRAGDFWKDDLGSDYDTVLLFNIVHANLPDKNAELVQKAACAMNSRGTIVILDQLIGEVSGAVSRAVARLMGLSLFNLAGGQAYRFEEIAGWLRTAGFDNPRRMRLLKAPGSNLVLGTKAA